MENRFASFSDEELLEFSIFLGLRSRMSKELNEERFRRHKPAPIVIGLQGIEAPKLEAMGNTES